MDLNEIKLLQKKNKNKLNKFILLFSLILIPVYFSFYSCKELNKDDKETIEKWIQKKILIPQNITFKSQRHDTICLDILKHKYKILIYVDSTGCVPCHLNLPQWKAFIDTCKLKKLDVGFIFVVQSINYLKLEQMMYIQHFNYPIIYDYKDEFNKLNKFPKEERFHTLLLNKNNRVILIGSPIRNEKLKILYNNVIGEIINVNIQNPEIKKNTSLHIIKNYINLGKFSFQSSKLASFQLKNTGKQTLIIQNVNTSCGCTVAKFDKKPVEPGKTAIVSLEYKPIEQGYFRKTADVMCNVNEGFVRLTISGDVVDK